MSAEVEVNEDGIVIHDLEIEGTELAEFVGGYEDPADGVRELIDIAMTVRSRFTTDLETQNIRNAADDVIARIEAAYEQLIEDMQEEAARLVDPQDGPVIKALDRATGDNLKKLLNPERVFNEVEQSPMARLRGLLTEDIETLRKDTNDALGEIKAKLGIGVKIRKTAADGTDFEGKIDAIVQSFATVYGDAAISTGAKTESGSSKKGDTEVELNFDDTNGISCKIVWESKTDARFKGKPNTQSPKVIDDQVKKELNEAIDTRKAKSAIMVLDSTGLDMEAQPVWREYEGNKLLIVVDLMDPDEDLIRLGYLWGRWKARTSIGSSVVTIDFDGIKNGFDQIRLRLKDLRNVKKTHTDVIGMLNGASTLVSGIQKDTKRMMEELADTINIELADIGEEVDE